MSTCFTCMSDFCEIKQVWITTKMWWHIQLWWTNSQSRGLGYVKFFQDVAHRVIKIRLLFDSVIQKLKGLHFLKHGAEPRSLCEKVLPIIKLVHAINAKKCDCRFNQGCRIGFFYKTYVFGYLKSLKNTKSPVWVLKVFILCNLINKPHIQSSVLICEIH